MLYFENKNIDSYLNDNFDGYAEFRDSLETLNNDDIDFYYDFNSNEYIDSPNLPDKIIVQKYNKQLKLNANESMKSYHNEKMTDINLSTVSTPTNSFLNVVLYEYDERMINLGNSICSHKIFCRCNHNDIEKCQPQCSLEVENSGGQKLNARHFKYYRNNVKTNKILFYIDDYFNIFIPKIKTYLVFNYSKFPLFNMFISKDKLRIYHYSDKIIFNRDNIKDYELWINLDYLINKHESFKNNILIKLPENKINDSLNYAFDFMKNNNIDDFRVIDLRVKNQIILND